MARLLYKLPFLSLTAWPGDRVHHIRIRSRLNRFHRREKQDFLDVYRDHDVSKRENE